MIQLPFFLHLFSLTQALTAMPFPRWPSFLNQALFDSVTLFASLFFLNTSTYRDALSAMTFLFESGPLWFSYLFPWTFFSSLERWGQSLSTIAYADPIPPRVSYLLNHGFYVVMPNLMHAPLFFFSNPPYHKPLLWSPTLPADVWISEVTMTDVLIFLTQALTTVTYLHTYLINRWPLNPVLLIHLCFLLDGRWKFSYWLETRFLR